MRFVVVTGMSGGGKSTALKMLEDAGFSHVTRLDDLACTIEKGRILIEAPDEEDDAEVWDALREELPEGVCALLEDLGADPTEVWDILETC